jgi:hypothetical protein
MMVGTVDWLSPDFWVSTVAAPAWLLGDAKGDDVPGVLCSVEALCTHDAAVIHRTISVDTIRFIEMD